MSVSYLLDQATISEPWKHIYVDKVTPNTIQANDTKDINISLTSGHIKITGTNYPSTGYPLGLDTSNNLVPLSTSSSLLPWTPLLSFGTGISDITYTANNGYYTKIGNIVYFTCTVILSNKGVLTGTAYLNNLPYASNSGFNQTVVMSYSSGINMTSGTLCGFFGTNSTVMTLVSAGKPDGSAIALLTNTNFSNTSTFSVNGFYFTN